MQEKTVHIFAELGNRFASFGGDGRTAAIAESACRANPWFLPGDTVRAAGNIAAGMLSPDRLARWLSCYPSLPTSRPRKILAVMAGNIPFAGFQDLLCVLAAGHEALVKTSSKDDILMRHVVTELLDIDPGLPVAPHSDEIIPDAVIAMGGDNAIRELRAKYSGIPLLLRGNRSSAAVLEGGETAAELSGLAGDILSYSGLGCRGVSLLFVPRNYDLSPLCNALSTWKKKVNPKYLNNYHQVRALSVITGEPFIDCGVCLLREEAAFPAAISRINYIRYGSADEVREWLGIHDRELQCVAGNSPHPRSVRFGCTQRPGLTDYPDGTDTMIFLESI